MGKLAHFLRTYAWFILRNVLGWTLMLGAVMLGPLPGPGGIPLFLIGFALITFPGKRRFVARLLRGRAFAVTSRYRWISLLVVVLIAALIVSVAVTRKHAEQWLLAHHLGPMLGCAIAFSILCLLLLAVRHVLPSIANIVVRGLPKARMKVRPAMHRMGIRLLPPRWHHGDGKSRHDLKARLRHYEEEILAFGRKRGKQEPGSR
jgi:hypothetical protein